MAQRPTEYREHLESMGAEWGEWRERPVVEQFGDPDREYLAVRDGGAGLVDRMERETLVITGDEAVPWLQGLVTNDLLELVDEGAGQWNTVTNVNGRMLADLRVMHVPEMLLVDLEGGTLEEGGLVGHLRQQIIMEDVEIADRSESTGRLGLFGPAAAAILEKVADLEAELAVLGDFDGTWGRIEGRDVLVQVNPVTGERGFDLFFDREQALVVWEALAEAGGEVEPVGHQMVETLRIEAGIARFGVETTPEVIPLEADLGHLIDFEKGCYLGQEIIARLDTRGEPAKLLRTLVFEGGAAPAVGAALESEDREVGEVVSAIWSPLLEAPVALAYAKRGYNEVGEILEVEGRAARIEPLGYPMTVEASDRQAAGA